MSKRVELMARSMLATLLLMLSGACATIRVTNPPRTATEQFLMSEAIRKAVAKLDFDRLRDRKVVVDSRVLMATTNPSPEDLFAVGEVRNKLLASGARLVERPEQADVIVEVRTGGIGVDSREFLLGIPAIDVPTSAALAVATPEVAILKSTTQKGYAGIAVVAYWRDTGEMLTSSPMFIGRTVRDDHWILGSGPNTNGNIPPAQENAGP